jgi:hypothetical protein
MTHGQHQPASARGYAVDVNVLRVEKIGNCKNGNPRYHFHTESGIYTTADGIQASAGLIGTENGPAVFRVEGHRLISWAFAERAKPAFAA